LGQRAYLTRGSFHMSPAGVVELIEAAVTIDRVNGDAEEQEPKAEPRADPPRTGCAPTN